MRHGVPVRIGVVDFDPAQGVAPGESVSVTIEMDEPVDHLDGQEIHLAYSGSAGASLKGAPQIRHIEAGDDRSTFQLVCHKSGDLTITATTELEGGPQEVAVTLTIV